MGIFLVMFGLLICVWLVLYVTTGLIGLVYLAALCWPFVGGLFFGAHLVLNGSYYAAGVVVVVGLLGQIVWALVLSSRQQEQRALNTDPWKDPEFIRCEMEIQRQNEDLDRILHGDKRPKLFGTRTSSERQREV